jgi:hypothetical protein
LKEENTDIILFSVIIGEALALLAAAEFSDFSICLDTMTEIVRIVGGGYSLCRWALCVRIRGMA